MAEIFCTIIILPTDRTNNEALMAEKWEISASNTELKNRLQQSMAMSYMQGDNGNMLEEELHKMQVALAEERKVTEKLSRNLELEKRRVESLEQKAKGAHRFEFTLRISSARLFYMRL